MSNNNFLAISVEPGTKILYYQSEMITNNPHPGILPLKIAVNNQATSLYFQHQAYQPLAGYLRREDASKLEIIPFIIKMVDILLESRNLLLNPAAFSLKIAHVFLIPQNRQPVLVYLPWEPRLSLAETLDSFLNELKIFRPDLISDLAALDCLSQYLRRDYSSLQQLRSYLLQLRIQGLPASRTEQDKPFQLVRANEVQENYQEIHTEKTEVAPEIKEIKQLFLEKKKQLKIFLVAQVIIVILLLLCSKFTALNDTASTTAGMVLIIGAVNVLLLKKIFITTDTKGEEL